MENTDFIDEQQFLESKGFEWEKDKDCLWAEENISLKLKDLFALMNEYKIPYVSGSLPLADVKWLHIGTTDEYSELKKRIAHICHDVTDAACIAEICIHDIAFTFRQFGYEIVKR